MATMMNTTEVLIFASRPWWVSDFTHGHVRVTPEGAPKYLADGVRRADDVLTSSMPPSLAPTALSMAWRVRT